MSLVNSSWYSGYSCAVSLMMPPRRRRRTVLSLSMRLVGAIDVFAVVVMLMLLFSDR